jgi:hypothetical protein
MRKGKTGKPGFAGQVAANLAGLAAITQANPFKMSRQALAQYKAALSGHPVDVIAHRHATLAEPLGDVARAAYIMVGCNLKDAKNLRRGIREIVAAEPSNTIIYACTACEPNGLFNVRFDPEQIITIWRRYAKPKRLQAKYTDKTRKFAYADPDFPEQIAKEFRKWQDHDLSFIKCWE